MNQGVIYAIIAYLAWGLLPLYWKLFVEVSPWEIFANRIVWSFVFVAVILLIGRRWTQFIKALSDRRTTLGVIISSLFISANWFLYIWAVNSGHVLETSLGYYINPLISVLFGVLFLKERLRAGQWVAIGFAAVGVTVMAVQYGQFPWVAITLALTFALYGLAKKVVRLDSMLALAWETAIVFPISLLYLCFVEFNGTGTMASLSVLKLLLLLLAGVATALPLFWFAQAAKMLPLSSLGLFQYLSPSTTLVLAISVFHESFTTTHVISFGFIWTGLIIFTVATMRKKQLKQAIVKQDIQPESTSLS